MPDFSFESAIDGKTCGLDEVGRGPLAGPVVAACVYIPTEKCDLDFVSDITDSKKLSWPKLEYLHGLIQEHFPYGIAECSPKEIDEINILQASLKAMERAFKNMNAPVQHALVDGNHLPKNLPCPATPVIKGDSKSTSIAAASILAKVTRDRIMRELAREYPDYGWDTNVGYPSQKHRDAIEQRGITPHHRKSFKPVREYIERTESDSETRLQA